MKAASSPTPSTSARPRTTSSAASRRTTTIRPSRAASISAYGILYAGVWASGINFDAIVNDADLEIDWYGGIKPTWGPATFDFGVIYYSYPGAGLHDDPAVRLRSELRGAQGRRQRHDPQGSGASAATIYWSPDYFAQTGSVWTFEGYSRLHLPPGRRVHAEHHRRRRLSDQLGRLLRGLERLQRVLVLERRPCPGGREADLRLPLLGHRRFEHGRPTLFTCINDYCDSRFVFSAKVVLP